MNVQVQFFSQLKDVAGVSTSELSLEESAKVADLLAQLYARIPALCKWDDSLLVGAGLEFVGRDYVLKPGEEISIMPPVQGG